MARFWGDVARGFGPAYAASTARTDRRKAAELAQANLKASIERQDKLYAAMQAQKQEDIRAQAMGFTPETLAQAIEETGARETGYKAGLPPEPAAQALKDLTREQILAITSRATGIRSVLDAKRKAELDAEKQAALFKQQAEIQGLWADRDKAEKEEAAEKARVAGLAAQARVAAEKAAAAAKASVAKDAALQLAASQVNLATVNHGNNLERLDAANAFSVENAKTAADLLDKRAKAAETHALNLQKNEFGAQTDRDKARVAAETLRDEANAAQDLAAKLDAAYLSSGAVLKDNEKIRYRDAALQKDYPKMLEILAKATPLAEKKEREAEAEIAKELKEAIPGAPAPQLTPDQEAESLAFLTPELTEEYYDSKTTPERKAKIRALGKKAAAEAKARDAEALKKAEGWAAPRDTMSPSQRRIKDLLKVMNPEATDAQLAKLEYEHYERKGLSATDKGASDIVKVFEKWKEASTLIDQKKAKGEESTPDELRQFAVYEFEIQDHFGRRGRKIPGALLETMKNVWRFPPATIEGPVLGAQDIALSAEEAVRDLDYLVKTLGQDKLDKHVGIWDETEDAIIKKLFPPGTSMTDKEFQAVQSFKQVYKGLTNKILYLRSGATVTESEWKRIKEEIGVPDSADFFNRIRTFAKKERRDTKRLLQTRIKGRFIFADELQNEIMGGLSSGDESSAAPATTAPITPAPTGLPPDPSTLPSRPTAPKKLTAKEQVQMDALINKGIPNLTAAEKVKLEAFFKRGIK